MSPGLPLPREGPGIGLVANSGLRPHTPPSIHTYFYSASPRLANVQCVLFPSSSICKKTPEPYQPWLTCLSLPALATLLIGAIQDGPRAPRAPRAQGLRRVAYLSADPWQARPPDS